MDTILCLKSLLPWVSEGGLHVAVLIYLKHVCCVCPKRNISTKCAMCFRCAGAIAAILTVASGMLIVTSVAEFPSRGMLHSFVSA